MEEIDYNFNGDKWSNTSSVGLLDYENHDNPKHGTFGIICGVLAVLITLLNGALMIVILLKRKLRCSPKYFIVLNLSIVGFIDGVFLTPIQALRLNKWNLSCFLLAVAETTSHVIIFVELMLVTSLCIQWIASITIPSYNTVTRFRLVLFLVIGSWLSSFLATMVFAIPGSKLVYIDQRCSYYLKDFARIGVLLTIPVPLLLVLFVILVLLLVVRSRQRGRRYSLESNEKKFPVDIVLSSLILLLCITGLILLQAVRYITFVAILISIIARLRHILIPLIWLIMSKSIRNVVLCKREDMLPVTQDATPMDEK